MIRPGLVALGRASLVPDLVEQALHPETRIEGRVRDENQIRNVLQLKGLSQGAAKEGRGVIERGRA